jgi:predicted DNA-binding transcriptional regulator AlpA
VAPTAKKPAKKAATTASEPRLLAKGQVCTIAGLTFPTIWKLMRAGTFPRARVVGGRSMWLSSEIDDWITRLPKRRLKGDAPSEAAPRMLPRAGPLRAQVR